MAYTLFNDEEKRAYDELTEEGKLAFYIELKRKQEKAYNKLTEEQKLAYSQFDDSQRSVMENSLYIAAQGDYRVAGSAFFNSCDKQGVSPLMYVQGVLCRATNYVIFCDRAFMFMREDWHRYKCLT